MERFRVKAVPEQGRCTLILSGEADLAVADDIVELGTLGLEDAAIHSVIIDLNAVTFIDSTTLSALVRLRNIATERGKTMSLIHVPELVRRLLHIAGLNNVFTIA